MSFAASLANATTATAFVRARPGRRLVAAVPWLFELACVVAAIVVLLPQFDRVAALGSGRDQRFADSGLVVAGLPDPALPELCTAYGDRAETQVREALCGARARPSSVRLPNLLPPILAAKIERARRAFVLPLHDAEDRIATVRRQAQDGAGELRDDADRIAAIEAEIAPYLERFRIAPGDAGGPAPLRCATEWAGAALAARPPAGLAAEATAAEATAGANALLLLAAALDGRAATAALAADARLPVTPAHAGCPRAIDALAGSAAVMADARQVQVNERKNDAMRSLLRSAGWQWAGAMAIGFVFLLWSRHARRPAFGAAVALIGWACAGWAARVPWPFAGAHGFAPARAGLDWASAPAPFIVSLAGVGVLLALVAASRDAWHVPPAPQSMSSRVGYAGFVLATGLGFLVLLDLSLAGHAGNRYLALYHQGHLWLAMLTLSVMLFARRTVSRAFAWTLSVVGEAARRAARHFGRITIVVALVAATAIAVLGFGLALANMRQLTSELGRVWLILGAAWFFFLRAGPMTERLARAGPAGLSLVRYAWPMAFVAGVLVAAMVVTSDMGPLLISGYAAGAFVAAAVAMWWHHRSGQVVASFALAVFLFALWIAAVTAALFQVGAYDAVAASRLESVAAPFASINDQLALVSWFQRAAPAGGFGLGAAPWCGFAPAHGCSGVPAQIHSDYTFTALVGVFGPLLSWAIAIGAALWLHRLIRHHGRVTRGEPRLLGGAGRFANDGQALLSWIAVAWVVLTSCQLAVTVAGNLAVLPLTGVTFPFVSFGMTSLLVNTTFLALCLNVDLPPQARHG
jgi:cell division protein FtsW (lipid II flippase)